MGNLFLTGSFHLLHRVVQEKVYQNGVDMRLWILANDFSSYQLYTPNTASYCDKPNVSKLSGRKLWLRLRTS